MKVLHLITSLELEGAQSLLYNLISFFQRNTPHVRNDLCTLYQPGYFARPLKEAGVSVHCLKSAPKSAYGLTFFDKYDVAFAGHLVALIKEQRYDVIHAHLFPASLVAGLSSLAVRNTPWVFTEHSAWNRRRAAPLLRILDAFVYSRFQRVVAVSNQVANALTEWQPGIKHKLHVIPNGVPIPDISESKAQIRDKLGLPLDVPLILFVGRLSHIKGVDILLRSLSRLNGREYRAMLAGTGAQRDELEQLAIQLGVRDKVDFLGLRDDVWRLMLAADCLVLPSRWEGLPMVILEAMARAKPVIASAVGGIPEVIKDGVTGWLVPPEDPLALAETVNRVLSSPEMACSVGCAARELITTKFSIDVTAHRTLELYEKLLKAN
jgi:glycosyltransferase involved in cell wall biosynthesis